MSIVPMPLVCYEKGRAPRAPPRWCLKDRSCFCSPVFGFFAPRSMKLHSVTSHIPNPVVQSHQTVVPSLLIIHPICNDSTRSGARAVRAWLGDGKLFKKKLVDDTFVHLLLLYTPVEPPAPHTQHPLAQSGRARAHLSPQTTIHPPVHPSIHPLPLYAILHHTTWPRARRSR
jgi:hypothetical protein